MWQKRLIALVLVVFFTACSKVIPATETSPVGENTPQGEVPYPAATENVMPLPGELPYPAPPVESVPTQDSGVVSPYPEPEQPVSSDSTAPTATQQVSPLNPIPGEEKMVRGEVFIEESQVLVLESFPVQINLYLQGSLPTPCSHLRAVISPPDEQNRILVEIYSLSDATQVCIQVLQPFETNLPLGSFASGTYTIWVNGEQVGEFNV